jgi:hypothetical protein
MSNLKLACFSDDDWYVVLRQATSPDFSDCVEAKTVLLRAFKGRAPIAKIARGF